MKQLHRILLGVGIALLGLAGGALLAAHQYLRSAAVARRAEALLHETLGCPARVGEVAIGLFGASELRDIDILEKEGDTPWLHIDHVSADVSALDLLREAFAGKEIAVRGMRLRLRFDERNRLLTSLPEPPEKTAKPPALPAIRLEESQVILEQEGRAGLTLAGISGRLRQEGDDWRLEGDIHDPQWGNLAVEARADAAEETAAVSLSGSDVRLRPELLRGLPFVPAEIWKEVEVEGPAVLRMALRLGGEEKFAYRIEAEPLGTRVQVFSVGINARDVEGGSAVVDNGLVTLADLAGEDSGGLVRAKGTLDFRQDPWQFDLSASADGVQLQPFTSTWDLPPQLRKITGKLTGSADLRLTFAERLRISGEGEGIVKDAYLGDVPTDPITLRLYYEDGKPYFDSKVSALPPPEGLLPAVVVLASFREEVAEPPADDAGERSLETLLGYPSRVVSLLQEGVREVAGAVAGAGETVMGILPGGAPAKPGTPPTYLEVNFGFTDVDLKQLIDQTGFEPPFPVTGRGSIRVKVALPVDTPDDVATYRLDGTITLARIKIAELEMNDVEARVLLDKGVLRLETLQGRILAEGGEPGRFEGTARMQVAPLDQVSADLTLTGIPVAQVLSLAPGLGDGAGGRVNGTLTWSTPAQTLTDPSTWKGSARVEAEKLRLRGFALDALTAAATLEKGELTLTTFRSGVEGLTVTGSGKLNLQGESPYEVRLAIEDASLAALSRLAPGVAIPLTVEGRLDAEAVLRGALEPGKFDASGTVAASRIRLGDVALDSVRSGWKFDPDRVALEKFSATLYQGEVTGSASLPFDDGESAEVDLTLKGLDAGALARDFRALPVRLSGEVSGTLDGRLEPAVAGRERTFSARLNLEAPKLRVQNFPTESLRGRFGYRQGAIRYHLEGDALGGRFDLDGKVPVGAEPAPKPAPADPGAKGRGPEGSISIRRVRIGGLVRALGGLETPAPVRGLLDLELNYFTDATGEYRGDGYLHISRLRWDRTDLLSRFNSALVLRNSVLELRETSAEVLGGSLRLRAAVFVRDPDRSTLELVAERMELGRLNAIFPEIGLVGEGPLNLRLWTTLGREWRGGGQAELTRGKVAGVDVGGWHVPFRFTWVPEWNRGELTVTDSGAQLAMGRATGRATVMWGGGGLQVDVNTRFQGVELRSLLRPFVDVERQFGAGRASGRLDLTGREVRSLRDLSGRLELDFRQAQALQLPVLGSITPFLGGVSQATSFEKGDLRATLGRGIWRVQRLTAESRTLNLLAEGIVTVEGRLDLEVTARTGELFVNPVLLRLLGLSVGQPLPLEVLIRASEWLSNRVIHLRVGGTIRTPVVRVEPVRLLTEEAIRFFIRGTLPNAPGSRPDR